MRGKEGEAKQQKCPLFIRGAGGVSCRFFTRCKQLCSCTYSARKKKVSAGFSNLFHVSFFVDLYQLCRKARANACLVLGQFVSRVIACLSFMYGEEEGEEEKSR